MSYPLTVVIRFTSPIDLSAQLDHFEISYSNEIEVLFLCCGSKEDFDTSIEIFPNIPNSSFYWTDGDYASARAESYEMANGDFLLFPSVNFSYNWSNVLINAKEALNNNLDVVVLRSRNSKKAKNSNVDGKIFILEQTDNPNSYFQAFGCTLPYTLISKSFLMKLNEDIVIRPIHDNAFIIDVACKCDKSIIASSKNNGALKSNTTESGITQDFVYKPSSYIDSTKFVIDIFENIRSTGEKDLLDSYMRIFVTRIRFYLTKGWKYTIRKEILTLIAGNGSLATYLLGAPPADWIKIQLRNFTFVSTALKSFIRYSNADSYNYDQTSVVIEARTRNPKCTFIMSAFNSEDYIADALASVMDQTYENFEVICINDGSTDRTLDILKDIASTDDRVSVYTQPNMGLSIARNAGIRFSKGEFINFIDSDDMLDNEMLEQCMSAIEKNNLDIVLFDARSFFESNEMADDHKMYLDYYSRSTQYSKIYSGIELLHEMQSNKEYRPSACLYAFKKRLLEKTDLHFIPGILHEDNAFTFQLMAAAERASHINKAFYLRRVHDNSIVTSKKSFDNSYGYFKCATTILFHDFWVSDQNRQTAYEIGEALAYTMIRNAQKDLLDAEDGEEGGAYSLDDSGLMNFMIFVLSTERASRKYLIESNKLDATKHELSEAKKRIADLEKKLNGIETKSSSTSKKGFFATLRK